MQDKFIRIVQFRHKATQMHNGPLNPSFNQKINKSNQKSKYVKYM